MTPQQKQVWDMSQSGMSRNAIAKELGKARSTVQALYRRAEAYNGTSDGVREAMAECRLDDVPHSGWLKTDTASLYFQTPKSEQGGVAFLDQLKEVFSTIKPVPELRETKFHTRPDVMNVYPLMDAHIGMRAYGKETGGQDYDLNHAITDIDNAFESLINDAPPATEAVLILGGDTLHHDDNRNVTPASKHTLDVDGRIWKVATAAVDVISSTIERLSVAHDTVRVRVLRGNHDEHSHLILAMGLRERYALTERVIIEEVDQDWYWLQWGKSMFATHHGDKIPAQRLAMLVADKCPFYSLTRDRHLLTGHVHHEQVKDLGGVKWWSLRAFCPADNYGAPFSSRRALQVMSLHKQAGLKSNMYEPIWRE